MAEEEKDEMTEEETLVAEPVAEVDGEQVEGREGRIVESPREGLRLERGLRVCAQRSSKPRLNSASRSCFE